MLFVVCTCCNLPATITIETSFLVLQIEITANFSLRSFEHCKEGIPQARCILHLQSALVPTSLLYSISHTSLARVISVFSSEAIDEFFRAHWSRHLCCKALVDRQAHVQPTSPSIYIEGTSSLITLSPSLVEGRWMARKLV